jgi:transposase
MAAVTVGARGSDQTEIVFGVDTHKDCHVVVVLSMLGTVLGSRSFATTAAGYRSLLAWVETMGRINRAGVEGTGSYGAGLARSLRAAGLLRALREADPDYVLLDGTLAECDRVGDSRADFSHKHRRHGVNVQVVTDPAGRLLWISPTLPGRAHDLTAARTHRIIRICERQGVPILADRAYMGAGPWVTTPLRRPPGRELTPTQQTVSRALSAARAPVERGVARLKSWRIFRRSRCSPNRMSSISAAQMPL